MQPIGHDIPLSQSKRRVELELVGTWTVSLPVVYLRDPVSAGTSPKADWLSPRGDSQSQCAAPKLGRNDGPTTAAEASTSASRDRRESSHSGTKTSLRIWTTKKSGCRLAGRVLG